MLSHPLSLFACSISRPRPSVLFARERGFPICPSGDEEGAVVELSCWLARSLAFAETNSTFGMRAKKELLNFSSLSALVSAVIASLES